MVIEPNISFIQQIIIQIAKSVKITYCKLYAAYYGGRTPAEYDLLSELVEM